MRNQFGRASALPQPVKDTINGFNLTFSSANVFGLLHAGITAWNSLNVLGAVGRGYGPSFGLLLVTALCYGGAWYAGKQSREQGLPPRYIR